MEQLDNVNTHLQAVLNKVDRDRTAEINKLRDEEQRLLDRLRDFEIEKEKAAAEYGTLNVSDDDLIEINVGGKIIAAKRGTLCQWEGTRLEALFSGRWDKKLVRDNSGRIFLDLNGDCFQMIVDYMNELTISSEEDPPEYPTVNEELEQLFQYQLQLFGLSDPAAMLGSEIIKRLSHGCTIHSWLNENDGGSEYVKIYCSSRDGLSAAAFHQNCNRRGPTVTVIETATGDLAGGYTNTSWDSESYYTSRYASANKAFLFALSGFGTSSPCKMELKDKDNKRAMDYNSAFGPAFGGKDGYRPPYGGYEAEQEHDLKVAGSTLTLNTGIAYKQGPASMTNNKAYAIKRIEVFSVSNGEPIHLDPRKRKHYSRSAKNPPAVDRFTKEVNEAINEKWKSLSVLEAQISSFEESFADEQSFIDSLSMANGETCDIITLNVSGTMMTTNRATLMVAEDSVLAQQFDDTKWTEQGNSNAPKVKEWTSDDVTNWVKSIEGIPDSVASLFWENEINGLELLALNEFGLDKMGVKRVGTICLLLDEIKSLKEKVNQDVVTLIEHSPYCFGKILDHLRLKRLRSINLLAEEPSLPTVCESQKKRFEKVVKYYFPGDSSSFILGPPLEP